MTLAAGVPLAEICMPGLENCGHGRCGTYILNVTGNFKSESLANVKSSRLSLSILGSKMKGALFGNDDIHSFMGLTRALCSNVMKRETGY